MDFKCLLCGDIQSPQIIKNRTRNSSHNIVMCRKCGLQQLFPLPTIAEDERHYDMNPHDRETTPDFDIEDIYHKFEYQNQYRVNYLEQEIGLQKEWKILDYGCGYGFLMEMLLREGYQVEGLEISADRLEVIKARQGDLNKIYSFNILDNEVSVPKEMIGKYDCVMSFHLIEHISAPIHFLCQLKKMIRKGGYLLMEMPNISNILMDLSPEFNDYNYIRDHVAYYTPELIRKLCEDAGFSVIRQRGVQIYGLMNNMNWIVNGTPQLSSPSYVAPDKIKWLEDCYKEKLNNDISSEFMYILARND